MDPIAVIPPAVLDDLAALAALFMKITMRDSRPFICSHRSGRIYTDGLYTSPPSTSAANDDAAGAGDGGGGAGDGAGGGAGDGAGSEAGADDVSGRTSIQDPAAEGSSVVDMATPVLIWRWTLGDPGLFIVGELIPFDEIPC